MGLHDEASGVIVAEKCTTGIPEMFPQHIEKCAELSASYAAYDYGLLMNTTFGLVPGGASPGSFRLGEVSCTARALSHNTWKNVELEHLLRV